MTRERDSSFEKMFDSRLFINTSRALMIVASVVGLPTAGFMMKRLIDQADTITSTVDATALQLKLLDQSVRLTFEQRAKDLQRMDEVLKDHEGRIRVLERADASPGRVRQ